MKYHRVLLNGQTDKDGNPKYVYISRSSGMLIHNEMGRFFDKRLKIGDVELKGYLIDTLMIDRMQREDYLQGFLLARHKVSNQVAASIVYACESEAVKASSHMLSPAKKIVCNEEYLSKKASQMFSKMEMTQIELSKKIGVSNATLSRILKGTSPVAKHFDKIYFVFHRWRINRVQVLRNEIKSLQRFKKR